MVRMACLLGLAVATTAASPLTGGFKNGFVYQEATIAPSTGAAQAVAPSPDSYAPAPVPNIDEAAPVLRTLGPAQAELKPGLFNTRKVYRGDGFTPDSTIQANEERHIHPAPGFSLNVPLQ